MFGIFMESVVIFKLYTGYRILMALFVAAFIYLLITEKDKYLRSIFVYAPLIILAGFFFPLTRKAFVAFGLDGETYYRVLWLIPMSIITAYAACKLWKKHTRIGIVVMAALICLGGSLVYKSPYITKAENSYHIPNTVVRICDLIAPAEGEERVCAAFPSDLVHFVRQYDSDIKMPYGRDMLVARWDYYNEVYEVMEKPEVIDAKALIEATRNNYCEYIILPEEREIDQDLTGLGLELMDTIDGYLIYQDPVAVKLVDELG